MKEFVGRATSLLHMICVASGVVFCLGGFAFADDTDPQWTKGSWSSVTPKPAENNVFAGLNGQFTDGSFADKLRVDSFAVQTYRLQQPANISEIRIYNQWNDTGRQALNVTSVDFSDAKGLIKRLNVPVSYNSGTAKTYGILKRPDGLPLCLKATVVTINFGEQQNTWIGCAEIEAIAVPDDGLGEVLEIVSSIPGFGEPDPAYGIVKGLKNGSVVPMSQDPEKAVVDIEDGVRCVCKGWKSYRYDTGEGAFVLASESGEDDKYAFDYEHGASMGRVVWQWTKEYRTEVSAGAGGSVAPSGTIWVSSGEELEIAAEPGEGKRFAFWSGNPPQWRKLAKKFVFSPADEPLTVEAQFTDATVGVHEVTTVDELSAALSSSGTGDEIVLKRTADNGGVFALTTTLTIDKSVTVRGETGEPSDVVLAGGSGIRVVSVADGEAVLSSVTVRNGKLTTASAYGAGIHMTAGAVRNCIVTGCELSGMRTYGSGVYLASQNCLLENTEITQCKGGTLAYGCGVNNAGGTILGCRIHGNCVNTDIYEGIGLYQSGKTAFADRCVVTNNTYAGGRVNNPRVAGVALYGGEMRNSLVAANGIGTTTVSDSQPAAGGIRVDAARLVNCTVADNFSGNRNDCAGLMVTANATVENCYVVRNVNKYNGSEDDTRTAALGTWFGNVINGASEIVTGAQNREPSGELFKEGSFGLPDGSVCIGWGVLEDWMAHAVDLVGRPRLRSNSSGESIVDAGCYAYIEASLAVPIFCDDDRVQFDGFRATVRCEPSGDTEGLVYYWDLDGDGSADRIGSGLREVTIETAEFGDFQVKLYATNAVSGASAESASIAFTHMARTIYVNASASAPVWPYRTPATAATNFEDAVDVANLADGLVIKVEPGRYPVTRTTLFTAAVAVEGQGKKREDVEIVGNGTFRIIYLQKAGATLRNLTVSGGYVTGSMDETQAGGGIRAEEGTLVENCKVVNCGGGRPSYGVGIYCGGATLRNCHVTGIAINGGAEESPAAIVHGAGVFVTGAGALVERCLVENCSVTGCHCRRDHAQGTGIEIRNGTVRASLVRNCSLLRADEITGFSDEAIRAAGVYMTGGKLVNCTVLNCRANYGGTAGVLARGGIVENCIIWGNARNEVADGAQVDSNWASACSDNYKYCCTIPALPDEHSINKDPGFRSPQSYNGKLSKSSPCGFGAGCVDASVLDGDIVDFYGRHLTNKKGLVPMGCAVPSENGIVVFFQ